MKHLGSALAVAGALLVTAPRTASAVAITVCNTGQPAGCSGTLADLANDPNYTIISGPTGCPGNTRVVDSTQFPIPPWIADDANSKWISSANADIHGNDGSGPNTTPYVYRTTFNLTGFDLASVTISGNWATDDIGTDILINGFSTGQVTT